ncbi:helix-turn-helix domain-containing protein [Roseivivax sp. THAF40]|uniref:helix-turn-helix domain-containing protein n=1 Tax=Roseivivax sp. THAF40 TaxID=2587858 RepID=UPI001561B29F|nr:YdaS family helix-turn-helix protein [Roseivivax sp. THAF40]
MTRLATFLNRTEMTQGAFAQLIGVSQPTVHRWLHRKDTPTFKTAAKIERMTEGAVPIASWAEVQSEDAA